MNNHFAARTVANAATLKQQLGLEVSGVCLQRGGVVLSGARRSRQDARDGEVAVTSCRTTRWRRSDHENARAAAGHPLRFGRFGTRSSRTPLRANVHTRADDGSPHRCRWPSGATPSGWRPCPWRTKPTSRWPTKTAPRCSRMRDREACIVTRQHATGAQPAKPNVQGHRCAQSSAERLVMRVFSGDRHGGATSLRAKVDAPGRTPPMTGATPGRLVNPARRRETDAVGRRCRTPPDAAW